MSDFKKLYSLIKRDGIRIASYKVLRTFLSYLPLRKYYLLPKYIFMRIFDLKPIIKINGFDMELNIRKDTGLSKDLFFYGERESFSTSFLINSNLINLEDSVLDIGANVGYYALIESGLVGKGGLVYALEPVSDNFECLKRNIFLNKADNIIPIKIAAGASIEKNKINVSRKGNLSSLVFNAEGAYKQEDIDVITIDNFLIDKKIPTMLRMDVEGYEWAIIEGAKKTLTDHNVNLFIEIHPHLMATDKLSSMLDFFKNVGYAKADILYDPNPAWLNSQGNIRSSISWVMGKLGEQIDPFNRKITVNLENLASILKNDKKVVQVLLFR